MILPAGCVKKVKLVGRGPETEVQVSVISAGPPDQPATVWAVTVDLPRRYVLVKQDPATRKDAKPRYLGMLQ